MKLEISAILFAMAVSMSACAAPAAANDPQFSQWLVTLSEKVKSKSDYKRLPLDDKASQDAFVELTYRVYKGDLSIEEYKKQMNQRFPDHASSVEWLAAQVKAR